LKILPYPVIQPGGLAYIDSFTRGVFMEINARAFGQLG
jgi:hypothetical protein